MVTDDEPVGVDCQAALDTLYRFLDGALDDQRRSAIRSHLDDCGHCLETYSFESEIRDVVAKRSVEVVPEGLMERIADRLRQLDD
jgi:mycothiol system anti-sigma-R factor